MIVRRGKSRISNPEPRSLDPLYVEARLTESRAEIERMIADIKVGFSRVETASSPISVTNADWWAIVAVSAALLAKTYVFNDAQSETIGKLEERVRTLEKAARA